MADLIQIKGGNGSSPLQDRELAYKKDTEELYIGTSSGNKRLCGAGDVARLEQLIASINAHITTINARLDALSSE